MAVPVDLDDLVYTWSVVETWTVRICLFFGALTILPYVMILFVDCLLYFLGLLQFPLVALRQLRSRRAASTNYSSSGGTGSRSGSSTPGEQDALLVEETSTTTTTVTTTSSNVRKRTVSKSGHDIFNAAAMATMGVEESNGEKAEVG